MRSLKKTSKAEIKLDEAARAGWLYYVASKTQDEIARELGVSRQTVQRLISLSVSEHLVKIRIDHPIAVCMELALAVKEKYGLVACNVVPSDKSAPELLSGLAISVAADMEKYLRSEAPQIIALGTGRALRACIEQLPTLTTPQHTIVSRLGNMMTDGSATQYNAVTRMAEKTGSAHYPMALPLLAHDAEELKLMQSMEAVRNTLHLCDIADATFVGVGQINLTAPLVLDGFMTKDEATELQDAGAAGEITSIIYDNQGVVLDCAYNARVSSAPLKKAGPAPVTAVAAGPAKVRAIQAALVGSLVNRLTTDEATAKILLSY
ncbi:MULTISPECIES: sugar-binding transcriptional regulator [Falsihalocynthiibacter]|uniref:sugar-binding transcriptional regulator n=1 Tax=Falsihalocynthiibacter TaxID=2854182 RepID=UPI003002562B